MSSILTIALTAAPSLDVTVLSWLNDSHSLWLDVLATYLTAGWTWLPLYIALFILVMKNNETIQQVGLVMGCTLLALILAGGVDNLIVKPLVARPRPSSDPIIKYMVDVVAGYRGKDFSFFSAHAANTMAIATFFIWLVRDKLLSVMLVCWSLINCWTRLHLGMHYPSDIVVGLVWGVISGGVAFFFFNRIYYRISEKINYISSQYSSTGYAKTDIDIVATILTLTLAVVMLMAAHTAGMLYMK